MNALAWMGKYPQRIALAATLAAAASASPATAVDGVAYRVKDIDPAVAPQRTLGLQPAVALETAALAFPAPAHYMDLGSGELWVTDGTTAGTRLFRDLHGGGLREAVAVGGGALFVADSPATGYELWWTDGTISGTRLVEDILPGPSSSMPALVGVLDGVAYLAADDGVHGRELWRSDGTAGGTWLFADIHPGAAGSLAEWDDPDRPGGLFNGRLYFAADDGVHGRELWRSDGHPAGTYLLKSIVAGAAGGSPRLFSTAAGRLFFVADDLTHGAEPWTSDGSAAGTRLVRDIVPGSQGSSPRPLGRVPGRLVFFADSPDGQLWASDGSPAGTLPLTTAGISDSEGASVGPRVLVMAYEDAFGQTLWATDGTVAGTVRVRDDLSGVGSLQAVGPFALLRADFEDQRGVWRSDGTAAGTSRLEECGCDELSAPVAVGSGWLFSVRSYVGPHGWDRTTLHRTDGTPAGTGEIHFDLPKGEGSGLRSLTARQGGIVFTTQVVDWATVRSDGTEAGTYPLTYAGTGWFQGFDGGALLADGEIVFPSSAEDVGEGQLFRTDGDLVSAVTVIDNGGEWPSYFTRSGDLVYFATDSIWKTDGSAAGTSVLKPVRGFELTDVFGTLWFAGVHEWGTATALWESHGTPATTIAHPLGFAMDSDEPNGLTPLDPATGSFVFRAAEGLYLFDPVTSHATRLKDFSPAAPPHYSPFPRAVVGRKVFFFDGNADGTCALWKSDGTTAGTAKVKDIGIWGCQPAEIVAMGSRVYFRGCDRTRGCELWRSDGTAAGTGRFLDLDPGIFSAMPSNLTAVEGRIYFSACNPWRGCEPWVSDGTGAGTHRLGDIAPGPTSSSPSGFTASGRLVYFSADDDTGEELWAVPAELFYDGFEGGDLARWEVF